MTPVEPRILVWNEWRQEQSTPAIGAVYPDGIHGAIREGLARHGLVAATASLDEPEHGLSQDRLDGTDVMIWWGHIAHEEVTEAAVRRVAERVRDGMGLVVLHSGQGSRVFQALMGTTGDVGSWREDGKPTHIWTVAPGHPLTIGVPLHFVLPAEEAYGEPFDIPQPDELVFLSSFEGGEAFRSGCCYRRGRGRVFYFQPGHETHPTYHHPMVRQVIANAVRWAAPATNQRVRAAG
jgi:trehalose utilization protein